MLSIVQESGNIAKIQADFSWGDDLDATFAIVSRYFSDFNENGFFPHPEEESLREALLTVPTLRKFSRTLRESNARGVIMTDLGLRGLPEDRRNAVLYAIALTLGFPTSTDQRTKRVAWDVKARPEFANRDRFVTFSERISSADMHTDSSFYPMPEEQFFLYVVQAARCNGGHSLLVDCEDVFSEMQKTDAGRAAYALLSTTAVPFRVPSVYAANDTEVEVHLARVIVPAPKTNSGFTMRWRYDAIQKGLAARPDLSSPALEMAVELLNEIVEYSASRFKEQLPDDTLFWADNHRMLHGRTTYEDGERHLIRIRISNVPNAQRIGPSGIARD